MTTVIQFDETQARSYCKKTFVLAFQTGCAATYFKHWAGPNGQVMPVDHMVMIPLEDDGKTARINIYGCAIREFNKTYVAVPGRPNVYRKKAPIRAYQPGVPFQFKTTLADGAVEVPEGHGSKTDWLVQNPTGEIYRIGDREFRRTYDFDPV
jgi:hypothetical protein